MEQLKENTSIQIKKEEFPNKTLEEVEAMVKERNRQARENVVTQEEPKI